MCTKVVPPTFVLFLMKIIYLLKKSLDDSRDLCHHLIVSSLSVFEFAITFFFFFFFSLGLCTSCKISTWLHLISAIKFFNFHLKKVKR